MEQEKMEKEVPEENQKETDHTDSGWDDRILCSDGNCIGVIGSDGRCKECGKEYEGSPPEMGAAENEAPPVAQEEDLPPATSEVNEAEADAAPADDKWENRVLCSDGNCIGVIGSNGKCKECGKPYER
jgi:hypothetical protein